MKDRKIHILIRDGIIIGPCMNATYRFIGAYSTESGAQAAMTIEENRAQSNDSNGWLGYYTMPLNRPFLGPIASAIADAYPDLDTDTDTRTVLPPC